MPAGWLSAQRAGRADFSVTGADPGVAKATTSAEGAASGGQSATGPSCSADRYSIGRHHPAAVPADRRHAVTYLTPGGIEREVAEQGRGRPSQDVVAIKT